MATTDTPLSHGLAVRLVQIEKFVLPLVYAALAWHQLQFLRSQPQAFIAVPADWPHPTAAVPLNTLGFIRHVLVFTLMGLTGGVLLMSRPPVALPDKLKHILVPLAMSFYSVLYGVMDDIPLVLRQNFIPEGLQLFFVTVGVMLSVTGYCLSLWGFFYLRRAFALTVSVRKIVLGGPYAYVRHPIYAGYLLDSIGLLLVIGSGVMLVLVAGFIALLVCRARLEEEKLGEVSEVYRRHRQQTGFLFPRGCPGLYPLSGTRTEDKNCD